MRTIPSTNHQQPIFCIQLLPAKVTVNKNYQRQFLFTEERARRQAGPGASLDIGSISTVTGYFTQQKYLLNLTPKEMEFILSLAPLKLINGVDLLVITDDMNEFEFAPRYTKAVSSGATQGTPNKFNAVQPLEGASMTGPVYQWVIARSKPVQARKIATLAYNEKFVK